MTPVERGKLGGAVTKERSRIRMIKVVDNYNLIPNKCKHCSNPLSYKNRKLKFCNNSCSALFHSENRRKYKTLIWNCQWCNKEYTSLKWKKGKYCNLQCKGAHHSNQQLVKWLNGNESWNGQLPGRVKKYIASIRGYKM